MRYIALSRFHSQRGPEIALIVPIFPDNWVQEQITRTLDILDNPGFFTQQYTSNDQFWEIANLYFEIMDPSARGGVQMALLSLILTNEDISTYIFQNDMYKLSNTLTSNPYFAQLLSGILDKDIESKLISVTTLILTEWLYSLPKAFSPLDHKVINLFFFGFKNAGKSSIIKYLKEGRFLPTIPNLSIDIMKVLIEGLQYISVDIPNKNQQYFRDSWKQWLKSPDVLVLVIDSTAPELFIEIKEFLLEILNIIVPTTVLVLCNKNDEKTAIPVTNIIKSLEVDRLDNHSNKINIVTTNAKTGLGLPEVFGKIIEIQLSIQQIKENKDQSICLILAKWNEETGPEIEDFYPKPFPNIISKDELIVQAFTIGANIFGKTTFQNNIISVPFFQQKLRSRLFFNTKNSPFNEKNENYLLGIFTDLITTNENIFGQFEFEINHFMRTEFLNDRIDLSTLYKNLSKLVSEKKRLIKRLSAFNQNWLLLFQYKNSNKTEIEFDLEWKFGQITAEMTNKIKNFVAMYLNELSTSDIIIKCKKSEETFSSDIEILLSSFADKYILIGANLPITATLINQIIIEPSPATELAKNILSAHIMSKYAEIYSNLSQMPENLIDTIFEEAFFEMDIEPTRTIYAKNGNCNLSDLQIAELLYLHWYLSQKMYINDLTQYENNSYALIIKINTRATKFYYNIDNKRAQFICNKALVLIDVYYDLFGYIPEKIFIHSKSYQQLFYDPQSNLLLIITCPEKIFLEMAFFNKLKAKKTIKKNDWEHLLKKVILVTMNTQIYTKEYPYYQKIWDSLQNNS